MQQLYDASAVGNTTLIENYAYGVVTSANDSVVTVSPAFGTFLADEQLVGANSAATANITSQSITSAGATGTLTTNTDANTWVVQTVSGEFTANNQVRGARSLTVETISVINLIGASDVWYNGNAAANGVVDTISNTTVSGIVVGQNTTYVGLFGNTTAFSFVANSGS